MACFSGPEIVNDGLVFAYDMGNSKKSWFGRPTTNLIGPNNDSTNIYMPSNRPYSGLPHSQSGNITTEVPPPIPGQTVYKIIDDAVDTQNARYSIRVDMTNTWIDYDKTYIWSCFVWLPAEYADRWTGTFSYGIYQNTSGTDWHGTRGYDVTYNYYSAGTISTSGPYGISSGVDKTKLNQWQRIWTVFTPLTANIQLAENNGNDNNKWVAGYMRVNINDAVNGGTPYHLYLSGGQIEEGNFVTDFVTNSRDVTDSIKDLTNNNTITATGLTYNSNGTFSFDGVDDRITITNFSYPASWDDPFSIETAIYIPAGSDWHDTTLGANGGTAIVGRGGYVGSHGLLRVDTQSFRFWIRTDGGIYTSTFSGAAFDAWYILTGTYDGTTNSLYVNGNFINSATVANKTGVPGSGSWLVGGNIAFSGNNGLYGAGNIPFVKIYSKSLSAEEVKQNFNALRGRFGI